MIVEHWCTYGVRVDRTATREVVVSSGGCWAALDR